MRKKYVQNPDTPLKDWRPNSFGHMSFCDNELRNVSFAWPATVVYTNEVNRTPSRQSVSVQSMRITNDYYLSIDVEATCSDVGEVPRHEMEIIEIGAVMQCSRTFEIQSEFQAFVRPVRNPVLTDFCTELTG